VIQQVNPTEILSGCRQLLGLPHQVEGIEDCLLAALLRRGAGMLAPCSRSALRAAVSESLRYMAFEADLNERIDEIIEGLVIAGDLLELCDVSTADETVRGTWVFPAPPSYVKRPGGSVFVSGTVPDQDTFLPEALARRVQYQGVSRFLMAADGEDLPRILREFGLSELSEDVWLKAPRQLEPDAMLASYKQRLDVQAPSGQISDLAVLDPAASVRFYKGRWTSPQPKHSGLFVARRPQEFGAPIWGVVWLETGNPVRFLDLPVHRSRWRGSDEAWHLQMAIDHLQSDAQCYRRSSLGAEARFDFFSPLPLWSQRRLIIFGRSVPREKCLMSFVLPNSQADTEERLLNERLWLKSVPA